MNHISIAIDGPSGAGKSTLARLLAQELRYIYVDTGAMYRAVGLHVARAGIDSRDRAGIIGQLPDIVIELRYENGVQQIYLNGENVSRAIRTEEASRYASDVSAIPEVRAFLLGMQRALAENADVIMDGRDIGTVVLPQAAIKIFLTASSEERARRRYEELLEKVRMWPITMCCAISSSATKTILPALRRLCGQQRTLSFWTRRAIRSSSRLTFCVP